MRIEADGKRSTAGTEYLLTTRVYVPSFDFRGGKAKPFTYSRNVPPAAYECGRGFCLYPRRERLMLLFSALFFLSLPFIRPFICRRGRTVYIPTPRSARFVYTRVCVSVETRTAIRQPLAVYPQSIKATCQHEYQNAGREVADRRRLYVGGGPTGEKRAA